MRVSERIFAVGYYDADGTFFYMAERGWGTRSDFDLSAAPAVYVVRVEESDGPYSEIQVSPAVARAMAEAL